MLYPLEVLGLQMSLDSIFFNNNLLHSLTKEHKLKPEWVGF